MLLSFKACQDPGILQTIFIIKLVIQAIFILVPIIIILTSIKSLVKAIMDSDDRAIKLSFQVFFVKFLVGIFIFFIPTIFSTFFSMVKSNNIQQSYMECYTNANLKKINYYKEKRKKELDKKLEDKQNESNKENNNPPNIGDSPDNGNNQDKYDSSTEQNNNNSPGENKIDIDKTIFIGDSRTVGMYYAIYGGSYSNSIDKTRDSEYWYASVGKGYSWFNSSALSYLKNKLNGNNYNVIILMGANDLYNSTLAHSYVNIVEKLVNDYPNSNFIFVSVNPIDDVKSKSAGYSVKNNQVITFNQNLQSRVTKSGNISYCDTYSQIINSFSSSDGLHYNNSTYKNIYNKIKTCR